MSSWLRSAGTGALGQLCADGHRELECLKIEHGFGGTALYPNRPGVVAAYEPCPTFVDVALLDYDLGRKFFEMPVTSHFSSPLVLAASSPCQVSCAA
jgi:hypothetical protein